VQAKYKRIVLKLSGESLAGDLGVGINPDVIFVLAEQIKKVVDLGVQVGVVVGGGNLWRGASGEAKGMDRTAADHMGMLATVMNSLAIQTTLERLGVDTRVLSAIEMRQVAEPYIRLRAVRHLEKGRVVIFAGGTGIPYFSTDTAAALRAAEIEADVILMAKKGVDGVYDADPALVSDAKMFTSLSYIEMISMGLKVMDATAASLCNENNIPLIIFNINNPSNIPAAVCGEVVGTYMGGA